MEKYRHTLYTIGSASVVEVHRDSGYDLAVIVNGEQVASFNSIKDGYAYMDARECATQWNNRMIQASNNRRRKD